MKLFFLLVVTILHTYGTLANPCVSDCDMGHRGDYQSCNGCNVYVTCFYGYTIDNRPCPGNLVWDDNKKRCEWTSDTCPSKTVNADCSATFSVSEDNELHDLYIDGKIVSGIENHDDWRVGGKGCIPEGARVIEIKALDLNNGHGSWGGVLLSTSTGFVTDDSGAWRCTTQEEPGWVDADFDDSHWNVARVTGNNPDYPRTTIVAGITGAKWIWAEPTGRTVFCRGRIPQPECTNTFVVSVDNELHEFYIDGKSVPGIASPNDWTKSGQGCLPNGAKMIAIKGSDHEDGVGTWPGILLSTSTGFLTNGNGAWRCTTQEESDWMKPGFDDSHWNVARVTGNNPDQPRFYFPEMDGAKWIWANPTGPTVYCRGHSLPQYSNKKYDHNEIQKYIRRNKG